LTAINFAHEQYETECNNNSNKKNVMQIKGNKFAAVKTSQYIVFNLLFNQDSKVGSAIFVPYESSIKVIVKKQKNNFL